MFIRPKFLLRVITYFSLKEKKSYIWEKLFFIKTVAFISFANTSIFLPQLAELAPPRRVGVF